MLRDLQALERGGAAGIRSQGECPAPPHSASPQGASLKLEADRPQGFMDHNDKKASDRGCARIC